MTKRIDAWSKSSYTEDELQRVQATIDRANSGDWTHLYKSGELMTVEDDSPFFLRWPDGGVHMLEPYPETDEEFLDWEDVEVI